MALNVEQGFSLNPHSCGTFPGISVGVVPLWKGEPKSHAWPFLSLQRTWHTQIAKTLPVLTADQPQGINPGLFLQPSWEQFCSFVTLVKITASLCELEYFQAFLRNHRPNSPVLKSSSTFMMVYSSKLSCRRTNCRLIWCMPWHSSNIADWRIRSLQRQGTTSMGWIRESTTCRGSPGHHPAPTACSGCLSWPSRPRERSDNKCNLSFIHWWC